MTCPEGAWSISANSLGINLFLYHQKYSSKILISPLMHHIGLYLRQLIRSDTVFCFCVESLVFGLPDGVSDSAIGGHAIWDTVRDGDLHPVYGMHVPTQEDAVSVVDKCEDRSNEQGDPDRRGYSASFSGHRKKCFHWLSIKNYAAAIIHRPNRFVKNFPPACFFCRRS